MSHIKSTVLKHFKTTQPMREVFETAFSLKEFEDNLKLVLSRYDFVGYGYKQDPVECENTFKGDMFEWYGLNVIKLIPTTFAKFQLTDPELANRDQMGYDITMINGDGMKSYGQLKFTSNWGKKLSLETTPNLINFPFAVSNDADASIFELAVSDPVKFERVKQNFIKGTLQPRSFIITNSVKVDYKFCSKHNIQAIERNVLEAVHNSNSILLRDLLLNF
jgi:hypothetical protein